MFAQNIRKSCIFSRLYRSKLLATSISPIKMILALKFKSMKLKDNYPKLILLLGEIVLISILGLAGIPMVIVFYIIVSLIFQKQMTGKWRLAPTKMNFYESKTP